MVLVVSSPPHSQLANSTMYRGSEPMGLDAAARNVDQFIQIDSSYPQLLDYFKAVGDLPNYSGQHNPDYPGLTHLSRSLKSLSQVGPIKKVPLPAELVEQFGHMQSHCEMGLFPEVGRGWLTIDKDIFVWTYEDGGDLAYFDGLSETILAVGLVRPKPGVFQNHIQFLLCLATPVEIALLGVSFTRKREDSPLYEEMHLLADPLFTLATDNLHIVTIAGTANGRIFMGSKDGSVLELIYQAEDGWFRRKCRKINHSCSTLSFLVPQFINVAFYEDDPIVQIEIDESRRILYTRSEKGAIQVFDLGIDGLQMTKITSNSSSSIIDDAVNHARISDRSTLKTIIHISAIHQSEATHVHLVGITQTGARLYFTTTSTIHPGTDPRPYTLALMHVRFPPGHAVGGSLLQPNQVHKAHYKKGTVILASTKGENDLLWFITNDAFPTQSRLLELHTVVPVSGKAWALEEIPLPYATVSKYSPNMIPDPPILVTQHIQPPRKFVLLSPQGSHIISKLQPVDQLRQLLIDHQGPDCPPVKDFFALLKEPQACAVSLILACSRNPQDKQVSEWATFAFFLYGNEQYGQLSQLGAPKMSASPQISWNPNLPLPLGHSTAIGSPMQASTPAQNMPYQTNIYGSPISSPQGYDFSHQSLGNSNYQGQQDGFFTAKHNGLYFYFGRIVRPLWNKRMVADPHSHKFKQQSDLIVSSVSSQELGQFLDQLDALKHFILIHSQQIINVQSGRKPETMSPQIGVYVRPEDYARTDLHRTNQAAESQVQEKISLSHLQQLINQTIEVLGLWKVLCDHQLHVVSTTLSKELQTQLKAFTCRDLVVAGAELNSALVTALINHYLDDNATTDAISNRLRDVCPSIFRVEDAVFSKAHEKLMTVRSVANRFERDQILKEALQLCQEISLQLQLPAVCRLFNNVQYYEGIVDLCLSAAKKRDPQSLAIHYYRNGEPLEDRQGLQAYASRMECYKSIIETLSFLTTLSNSHPQSPSVPKTPGPAPLPEPEMLSPEEAKCYLQTVFQLTLQSDDELFHIALYSWLVDQNYTDRLLELKSPYVENYLKRCAHPENSTSMDLMWKYYEKNRNFSAAARILVKLAETHSTEVNLQQRLEYLSRATICVKSSEARITSSATEGEYLHEIEEKMEVARIQMHIIESLQQRQPQQMPNIINAIAKLNASLLDVTELFEAFAEPFDLPEAKLSIIHCAEHYDPILVENLWQNIIDRELQSTVGNMPENRMISLGNKVKTLGRMYNSSQKYFPLAFLIKHLEFRASTSAFDSSWVFSTLMSIGITFQVLLEQYHKLYRSRDPCWRTIRKPNHLLKALCHLISHFAEDSKLVLQSERRALASHCLDLIASYLVDLQADSISDGAQQLMSHFREVQHKLERIV